MGKNVVFAVAGSGKTRMLIESLTQEERYLILTFTDNNLANLRSRVIQKFGYIPPNIKLATYFSFLNSFCYRPLFAMVMKTRGLNWDTPPARTLRFSRDSADYYLDGARRIYYGRLALFLEKRNAIPDIVARMEKYFDSLLVDEVQDFAGHDFNLLSAVASASDVDVLLVGDFYQHTFDTSRDGATNKTLHDDYAKYRERFQKMDIAVDDKSLAKSHRCAPAICDFVKSQLGIEMQAQGRQEAMVELVSEQRRADELFLDDETVKLFYSESSKYKCHSLNWGASKGLDHFNDVCVVLPDNVAKAYAKGKLTTLPASTRNKLYVACTRANQNLYLIPGALLKHYKASIPDRSTE
ncbi:superfamily I DNA/RNA helicase [Duganella sp. 1411]|uniref:AAA family ATPase n=1 Tax=Duganella sp. 1411 TaxID=2806572 RepID=UPI001AE32C51|nr:AAA family ATPase [Duganella sp. 1411]MBP1205789.1 superfamily I DNA/RNA helicase [Duganella sp. 1411]